MQLSMNMFCYASPIISHKLCGLELLITFSSSCQAQQGKFNSEDEPQCKRGREVQSSLYPFSLGLIFACMQSLCWQFSTFPILAKFLSRLWLCFHNFAPTEISGSCRSPGSYQKASMPLHHFSSRLLECSSLRKFSASLARR